MCYYINTFGKYALIFTAFETGQNQIYCYFAFYNLLTGTIGCFVFAPCIYVGLLDADRRHIILVKGGMQSSDKESMAYVDDAEFLLDNFLEDSHK